MQTIEISRGDWPRALHEFSALHEGWLVSLDILAPEMGAQPEVENLPLIGISTGEPATSTGPGHQAITVAVARGRDDHLMHSIPDPAHVWLERTDEGADAALEVESTDGVKTILRLKTPARPETVDGISSR